MERVCSIRQSVTKWTAAETSVATTNGIYCEANGEKKTCFTKATIADKEGYCVGIPHPMQPLRRCFPPPPPPLSLTFETYATTQSNTTACNRQADRHALVLRLISTFHCIGNQNSNWNIFHAVVARSVGECSSMFTVGWLVVVCVWW